MRKVLSLFLIVLVISISAYVLACECKCECRDGEESSPEYFTPDLGNLTDWGNIVNLTGKNIILLNNSTSTEVILDIRQGK